MHVSSVPQSPELPASILTSPLILNAQIAQQSPQQQNQQYQTLDCLSMSLSPQISFSNRRTSSISSDPLSISSSKSPKKYSPYPNITQLTLDLTKPPPISHDIHQSNAIEDSPELLATSVGAEIGSQLVPSISNISLLSLNQHNSPILDMHQINNSNLDNATNDNTTSLRTNNLTQRHLNININRGSNNLQPIQHAQFTIGSRKSSFHSPTLQSSQLFTSQQRPIKRRPSSHTYQHSSKQPIQIRQKRSSNTTTTTNNNNNNNTTNSIANITSNNNSNNTTTGNNNNNDDSVFLEPDSPNLDPVSLAGSPSNFLLSHSSPPNSLKSTSAISSLQFPLSKYNNINGPLLRPTSNRQPSQSQIIPLQQQLLSQSQSQSQLHPQSPSQLNQQPQLSQLKLLINRYTEDNLLNPAIPLTRENSIVDSIGGRSPELAPISTTLPPMTPLTLSMPKELTSRSNSTVIIDDEDEDIINEDMDVSINDLNDNTPVDNLNNNNNNNNNNNKSNVVDDIENDCIFEQNIDD